MTTAILISGQARSFARIHPTDPQVMQRAWARACFPNQHWMLYRKVDPEFFVWLADDDEAPLVEPLLLKPPVDVMLTGPAAELSAAILPNAPPAFAVTPV